MQFSHSFLLNMQAWHAQQGNWSFLILKDENGFICSYKNFATERLTITFKGEDEFNPPNITSIVPKSYYFFNLKEAQQACKKKYKELLLK